MAKEKVVKTGYSTSTLVFIVFLILKLTHTVDWSWWWITSPIWIPLGILIILLIVVGIGYLLTKN